MKKEKREEVGEGEEEKKEPSAYYRAGVTLGGASSDVYGQNLDFPPNSDTARSSPPRVMN